MYASSFNSSPHRYLPAAGTDAPPPRYGTLFPDGQPVQVNNAPAPSALRNAPAPPSVLRGWRRTRDSPDALPVRAPELHHFPSGVLPKKVKDELEQVLVLLENMNLKTIKACRQAQEEVDKANARLTRLHNAAPTPSAPLDMMFGGGLFDDDGCYEDKRYHVDVRRAEEKVHRLQKEQVAVAEKYRKKQEALNLQKLKLEAKIRDALSNQRAPTHSRGTR